MEEALAGMHGDKARERAERAIRDAVEQIADMFGAGGGQMISGKSELFASGGVFGGSGVVVEAPDGSLHGSGPVIASAHAYQVRPQDLAPIARSYVFKARR